jgi:hypothetical protein
MSLECPFSPQTANEKVVRLTAFLTVLLMLAGLFSRLQWIALLLCFDFFIRGFTDRPFSPLRRAAQALATLFRLKPEMINAGPKIFAAKIGFFFTAVIALTAFMGLDRIATILAALLILLASLEAFFKICVGCRLYSALQTLKRNPHLRKKS